MTPDNNSLRPTKRVGSNPIGVFDSGVGGLSVWREIIRRLPSESTLYFADQAHIPYGPRPVEEIQRFSKTITEYLLLNHAKLIVVACNTASGAALHWLRCQYPELPFVGMEPAVKPAAENTKNGVVGVLATPTTLQGDLYHALIARFSSGVNIHSQTCPGLVELIENGQISTPAVMTLLRECLVPLKKAGIDQLVLGCTHYPFARDAIQQEMGAKVEVIDPAPAVARQVERILQTRQICAPSSNVVTHSMITSGVVANFRKVVIQLLGFDPDVAHAEWHADRELG